MHEAGLDDERYHAPEAPASTIITAGQASSGRAPGDGRRVQACVDETVNDADDWTPTMSSGW
ncbi:hypothetical protein L3Q67_34985 [Saccharothrix sp. AJ9571]|nr:hypothetical protein L3Q67_34985 [Saccharothrix sp. AJ9571]